MDTLQFIKTVLIKQIEEIIFDHKKYYHAFILMSVGIRFLGKSINQYPFWDERHEDSDFEDFDTALKDLMPRYENYFNEISRGIGISMVSQMRPNTTNTGVVLWLTNKKEAEDDGHFHLEEDENKRLYLVCEEFYEDFKLAAEQVIRLIESKELPEGDKTYRKFLSITE